MPIANKIVTIITPIMNFFTLNRTPKRIKSKSYNNYIILHFICKMVLGEKNAHLLQDGPLFFNYSITSVTIPEPTVLPPSRIANFNPFSIAIGVISSIVIVTLSPGITISVPSGRATSPVTSVVLK